MPDGPVAVHAVASGHVEFKNHFAMAAYAVVAYHFFTVIAQYGHIGKIAGEKKREVFISVDSFPD